MNPVLDALLAGPEAELAAHAGLRRLRAALRGARPSRELLDHEALVHAFERHVRLHAARPVDVPAGTDDRDGAWPRSATDAGTALQRA